MQRTRPGIVAVLLVCACARTQDDAATRPPEPIPIAASAPSEPKAECGPPIRGAEAIVFPGSVTLLGEMHGTDAGPAVVARLACLAATQANAKSVIIGLEISRGDQGALDAALSASDADVARTRLVEAKHFHDEWQDGRDTEAIVALVERMRTLRTAGFTIDIVAFDVENMTKDARERDAKMAEHLAEAIAARSGATVLALSGNIHSRT